MIKFYGFFFPHGNILLAYTSPIRNDEIKTSLEKSNRPFTSSLDMISLGKIIVEKIFT